MTACSSTPMPSRIPVQSRFCTAQISPLGAILHDLWFNLPGGRAFSPLAEADWAGKVAPGSVPDLSPHLVELGGEWPCVPFGTSSADPQHHGFCSNADWTLEETDGRTARLAITYPDGHDIASVRREIRLCDDRPAVEFLLDITPARDCLLPIGLHPIFRVPDSAAGGSLVWRGGEQATTIPAELAPPGMALLPGTTVTKGGGIPTRDGANVTFPAEFTQQREALVQIWDCDGQFELRYGAEGAGVRLTWSTEDFPHCLLWLANPGAPIPGLGQFTGLGVEPVSSLFDRGVMPFDPVLEGRKAGVELRAGHIWRTRYEISAFALGQEA
ncbi:hypothetical protein Q4577_04455 [Marinovum sp. 2_MG-2023]|uniref:hypothetical protein n=1 Tax=unclassified Marinovum TaxID=2647166 RepID=UPI0026E23A92|nr:MULTISPECIES: hypothetical protein [unclassified Marinovum]MDO6729258.1 hypothetical protein [Marinovum sp. 2_MG-2023]MDO6779115.1 hypothetical protein [Marinovum sp. 1_MG-2023]